MLKNLGSPHRDNTAFLCVAIRTLYYNQPGHSRKDIRNSGFFKKDGEYWIDLENNGKPLKVYCDMTTDGGKKLSMHFRFSMHLRLHKQSYIRCNA